MQHGIQTHTRPASVDAAVLVQPCLPPPLRYLFDTSAHTATQGRAAHQVCVDEVVLEQHLEVAVQPQVCQLAVVLPLRANVPAQHGQEYSEEASAPASVHRERRCCRPLPAACPPAARSAAAAQPAAAPTARRKTHVLTSSPSSNVSTSTSLDTRGASAGCKGQQRVWTGRHGEVRMSARMGTGRAVCMRVVEGRHTQRGVFGTAGRGGQEERMTRVSDVTRHQHKRHPTRAPTCGNETPVQWRKLREKASRWAASVTRSSCSRRGAPNCTDRGAQGGGGQEGA